MPTPTSSVSTARLHRLADRLGHDVTDEEIDRFVERVRAEIDSYGVLERIHRTLPGPDAPRDVTVRPDSASDPHNAFLARFTLPPRDDGPLADCDVALKDNVAVAGVPMTCGSRVFEQATPGEHGSVVERLREAGATIVGKTNMDELAYGPTSETSQFGPVTNPADDDNVAGGSSSGSAAAVATGDKVCRGARSHHGNDRASRCRGTKD